MNGTSRTSRMPKLWLAIVTAACIAACCVPVQANASEGGAFGVKSFTMQPTRTVEVQREFNGEKFTEFVNEPYSFNQAGGHPEDLTTTLEFPSETVGQNSIVPVRDPKDVVINLPPGLLGDPMAAPRCSLKVAIGGELCPAATQIGVYRLVWFGGNEILGPIVNVTPEAGQSAEFVLQIEAFKGILTAHLVRTENPVTKRHEYGFTVTSNEIPLLKLVRVETTFWGVPADSSHDPMRGLQCEVIGRSLLFDFCGANKGGEKSGAPEVPFLIWPTSCSAGAETATVRADSWEEPGNVGEDGQYKGYATATATLPGVTGCNLLQFNPSLEVQPDTLQADAPVGLGVNVQVPQVEKPGVSDVPQVRKVETTLPLGMSISPGVVDGIEACNESGSEGLNVEGPESESIGANGEWQLAPGRCPDASTIGTAEAVSPLLREPVKGHVYLARPGCGGALRPCTEQDVRDGNLYKLYLELGGEGPLASTGIEIKVEGKTEVNPATGQITTVFEETPQAPYSELKIHLNGGPRAPLDSPPVCGRATTTTVFTPWSAPGLTPEGTFMQGVPDATSSSYYEVEPNGACADPPGLAPGFVAGTVTPNAGKFSSFTMNISRKDREQYVRGVQLHTPPGLLAVLAKVPLCGETQANEPSVYGECPASSKIGTTRVASGAGSHPFEIEGNIYLTGPHDGAPFGLSIVTHAVAGPFDLGLVVVRARIDIDPNDSTATITTDETGPYALPEMVFGVPLRLQRVTVDIDRQGFMVNPTNCARKQITARISGSQRATASVFSPFAVGGCRSLAFKPTFKVRTSGHTSRKLGASLDARVSYPTGALGKDANIARVKVSLPKQLPSYLSTLQKACAAPIFATNPASCPKASVVGIARTTTPLLAGQLTGPVYFVSHGGEEFPQLIVVLQGDGVRVDLAGSTSIKKGITSSTFKTVPDVPVNSFELYLPQRQYHALSANGNLCRERSKLLMPTEFVAQNGAVIREKAKIAVSGCGKSKAKHARRKRGRGIRLYVNGSKGRG